MGEVLLQSLGVYDNVIKVHQRVLPTNPRQDNVHSPLKGLWGILEAKRHPDEPVQPHMGRERRSIFVGFIHLHLQVLTVAVETGEDGGVSEGVNAFIYPRNGIRVPTGQRIEASVVHAKAEGAVFLWHQDLETSLF